MCIRWGCLAAWLCLFSTATGRDIFVNNIEGNDRSQGQRPHTTGDSGPVATISKALRLAEAGDRIVVVDTGQPYRETLSLMGSKHSAASFGPFTIEGNGAVLDGTAPVPDDAWHHHLGDVFYFEPSRLATQQLYLKGRPAICHPAEPGDVTLPLLSPLEWCLKDGRIYFRVEPGHLPSGYEATCCALQWSVRLARTRLGGSGGR